MAELTFRLFGSPSLISAGEPLQLDTRKAIALLAYLVVSGRPYRRDTLAGVLWPEYSQVNARAALRRTLSTLNKALGEGILSIQREEIGLQVNDKLWVDVVAFQGCLAEPAKNNRISQLEMAVDLYRGDFMEGFSLRDSLEFDDWQYHTGESLRQELAQALDELVDESVLQGKFEAGLGWMQRRLKIDPLHEEAHRQLMRLYAWAGKRNEALRQYHDCERILEEELGVSPLEETQILYRQIMDDMLTPPLRDTENSDFLVQAMATGDSIHRVGRAMIGRKVERELLHQAYRASLSRGILVGIQGEAGIGKTTMAEGFLSSLVQKKVRVLSVRCYSGEDRLVYNPLIEALRTGLRLPDGISCVRGLEDHWLAESARLLPELNTLIPANSQSAPIDGPGAQNRFYEGIRQTFKALLCNQNGGVIFFDDLHWADTATLDWLTYCVRRLTDFPTLILVTWRKDGQAADALHQWFTGFERMGTGQLIQLQPFDLGEVSALAKAEGVETDTLPRDFVTRLHAESEGNPFFVVEYLRSIQAHSPEAEWAIPASVRDLLGSRLIGVDETGLQLLGAAAIIGRSFDFDVVQQASGRSEDETVSGLEKLISQGLLIEKENPDADTGIEFDFSHQKMRSLVYDNLSQVRRRLLHRRVAEVLKTLPRLRRNPGQAASRIGFHYAMAGQEEMAAEYYFQAGEYAFSLYANNEAWEHFQNALQMGYPDTCKVAEQLGDLATLAGKYKDALGYYQAATNMAGEKALARIHYKQGEVCERSGDTEGAQSYFRAGLDVLQDGRLDAVGASRLYAAWGRACHHHGDPDCAKKLINKALKLAGDNPPALMQAHNVAGMLARSTEDYLTARKNLETSLKLAEESRDPLARAAAMNNLALVMVDLDEMEKALELAHAALAISQKVGDRHREAALLNTLADISHQAGQAEQAMEYLKQAVAIFAEIGQSSAALQPEIWKLIEW